MEADESAANREMYDRLHPEGTIQEKLSPEDIAVLKQKFPQWKPRGRLRRFVDRFLQGAGRTLPPTNDRAFK